MNRPVAPPRRIWCWSILSNETAGLVGESRRFPSSVVRWLDEQSAGRVLFEGFRALISVPLAARTPISVDGWNITFQTQPRLYATKQILG